MAPSVLVRKQGRRRTSESTGVTDSPLFRGPQVLDFVSHFCYLILQPLQSTQRRVTREEGVPQVKASESPQSPFQ